MSFEGRTYGQLQEEVLSFQFNEIKYRPLVKRWLNDGVRKAVLQSEIRTQEEGISYETEASVPSLEIPSNFARIIDFYDPEVHILLTPLTVQEYDAAPESSGRPMAYLHRADEILLYPTPDAVYPLTLHYWRLPADMVADTDEPELPAQYHDIPIAFAMQKAYLRENDYTAAQTWKAEWEAEMLKMRGEVAGDFYDGPNQVAGTYGDPRSFDSTNAWR